MAIEQNWEIHGKGERGGGDEIDGGAIEGLRWEGDEVTRGMEGTCEVTVVCVVCGGKEFVVVNEEYGK